MNDSPRDHGRLSRLSDPDPRRGRDPGSHRDRPARRRRGGVLGFMGKLVGAAMGLAVVLAFAAALFGYAAFRHYAADLPDVNGLKNYQPRVMSRVFGGDGRLIAELATERRIFVPFDAIPKLVQQAFVSAEDQNFWTHPGVDPSAVARAAVTDLLQMHSGKRPVGASTITQQVAKNMLLDNSLTLARKAKEWILATRIEQALTKQRILELYLNEIFLGLNSYGVAAAAEAYFGKPLPDVTLAEAAFLAALPKAPNNYNPSKYPDAARARRDWVLDRMAEDGAVSRADAQAAKAAPVVPAKARRFDVPAPAQWFAEETRRRLVEKFGADATTTGGLMVRTSLDEDLQETAERVLRGGLVAYDRKLGGWRGPAGHVVTSQDWAATLAGQARPAGMPEEWALAVVLSETDQEATVGWLDAGQPRQGTLAMADLGWARPVKDGHPGPAPRRVADVAGVGDLVMIEPAAGAKRATLRQIPAVEGALVCLDPATGRVLALVGGWSFEQSQFNRATQAIRQPGSSFKPFVYLTALEQGVSPSQIFLDAPFVVDQGAEGRWRPGNYDGSFNGPVSLHQALVKSLNLVTVRVAQRVGMDQVAQTAIDFGVVDDMPRVLPAALGAVGTTALRMAGAYAGLAEGGRAVTPSLIDSVQDRDGHVVWRAPGVACDGCDGTSPTLNDGRPQIADAPSVFQILTMMQDVVAHGTGVEAGRGLDRPIAGKTGTTQDFDDAWFVGFTPRMVTAVWVGFDTPVTLGTNETGGQIAAPIWHDFMTVALKGRPALPFRMPDGVTLAQWGNYTDAFKPGQAPGASGPVNGVALAGADAGPPNPDAPPPPTHGGVDASLGGVY